MTGFASKIFTITMPTGERSSVSMNLKSLNSRFFEITVKLPVGLSHLETTLIKLCKERLYRGHVYFTVHLSNPSVFEGAITPSLGLITAYTQAIDEIKNKLSLTDPLTLNTILRLPNIFSTETQQLDEQSTRAILDNATELINKVIQDREIEGTNLAADLYKRIAIIEAEMVAITKQAYIFIEEWKKKIHTTLQEIGNAENLMVDAQKNGLYSMLDKIDIHEEITRLSSHLSNLIIYLQSTDLEKGKRLDFTLQELGREINTIAAKCSNSIISAHGINVKVEIEKMREQIQNVV
jgi:uncharacterized protein (TIGR00255 family)